MWEMPGIEVRAPRQVAKAAPQGLTAQSRAREARSRRQARQAKTRRTRKADRSTHSARPEAKARRTHRRTQKKVRRRFIINPPYIANQDFSIFSPSFKTAHFDTS